MSFKTTLALALVALAAVPASAGAQAQIPPPEGDNYLGPIALSDFADPEPFPRQEIGFVADTTTYTTQSDMYAPPANGGPPEPNDCGSGPYGNTIWSVFHSDRWGLMRISTAGPFDSVIGFVPFGSPLEDPTPRINQGVCIDRLSGFEEELVTFVRPNRWYAVQVGGVGQPQGGQVQVKFDLAPPPELDADAVLTWNTHPRGAKVRTLVVSAPKDARVSVSCTKRGCRAPRPFTVKKPLLRKLGPVGPVSEAPAGAKMTAADGSGATATGDSSPAKGSAGLSQKGEVRAAKKYTLLRGKTLKAGSRLIIRVTRTGYIGKYFSYPITRNGVSAKTIRCTNPGSNRPRRRCG